MSEQIKDLNASDVDLKSKRDSDAQPAPPIYYRSVGRVCEILAVASLAACVFIYGLGLERNFALVLIFLLIALSVFMYKLAIKYALNASMAEEALGEQGKDRAAKLLYQVTDARLRTLKAAGVPNDVRHALTRLKEQSPLPEEKFLTELALNPITDLGWERTNEFREDILKYTKVDRKAHPATSNA